MCLQNLGLAAIVAHEARDKQTKSDNKQDVNETRKGIVRHETKQPKDQRENGKQDQHRFREPDPHPVDIPRHCSLQKSG
jgi:hypothetical protein